jgi:hypothetical protein
MSKRKRTKEQPTIYTMRHRKLKIEQQNPLESGVILGAPEV